MSSEYAEIDQVFISGIPDDCNEQDVADLFGQIGLVKENRKTRGPEVYFYKDKETGRRKGEATLTYVDPETSSTAVEFFNGAELKGKKITVVLAEPRKIPPQSQWKGRGGGGGGGFAPAPAGGKPGDWSCPNCNNLNFKFRVKCQKCDTPKPGAGMNAGGAASQAAAAAGMGFGHDKDQGGADWTCPNATCMNTNWARRSKCNMCGEAKPQTYGGDAGASDGRGPPRAPQGDDRRGGYGGRDRDYNNRGGGGSYGGGRDQGGYGGGRDGGQGGYGGGRRDQGRDQGYGGGRDYNRGGGRDGYDRRR